MEYLEQNFSEEYCNAGIENSLWEVISDRGSINSSENSSFGNPPSVDSGTASSSTLDDSLFDILFTCPETPAENTAATENAVKTENPSPLPFLTQTSCTQAGEKRAPNQEFASRVTKKPKLKRILTSTPSSTVIKIEPAEEYEEETSQGNQSSFEANSPSLKVSQCVLKQPNDRNLSAQEVKDLKRKQRMIRNRESASLSRQRRKAHLEGIEKRNSSLENENRQLKHTNVQLQQQIQYLQRELLQLRPLVATFK
ncbi:Oidioi.mRNA.OKI2018_I69.chr2.g5436.t1.cds [Oikopleura dioica]|uniref:Oidioi.mRNA.OKI2018_I69.chr2.g5436.t1.cds n=1 Tax=Oikopleura dioica TaxID=34765 RepID=A0ABN7T099_OIKDI|nr:Oidioi.mRNA.OKI2018_I69.chr2.g5436.t1.cds [Oikopleura dioica]